MNDDTPGAWLCRAVPLVAAIIFILTLCALAGYVYVGAKVVNAVSSCTPTGTERTVDGGRQYVAECEK